MVRVQFLSGVCAACCTVTFVLQGCGTSSDGSSTTAKPTTTAKPNPAAACMNGFDEAVACCCMNCPSLIGNYALYVDDIDNCTQTGGQCKLPSEIHPDSFYLRPPPAALAHPTLRERSAAGVSEQHHVIGGEPDEVTIVFVQPGDKTALTVEIRVNGTTESSTQSTVTSSYSFFENPGGWNGFHGSSRGSEYFPCAQENGHPVYQNATCFYTSDIIHKTQVTNLTARTAYDYRVQGEDNWRTFKTPPAVGSPIAIGLVADLGQSSDSYITMQHMKAAFDAGDFDMVVFPGDLSYADGYAPAWDEYGRLSDFLFSSVPTAYGVGNHEATSGLENNINFLPRYGWGSSKSTSSSSLWFSYDAGLAHVIMMCSYCDTVEGSAQYVWLQRDLAAVDRSRTPWVVMSWHVPFYTSSTHHSMEGANADGYQQRAALEDLIYEAKVDIAIQGHVHSYERTDPVYLNKTRCDGPVYITIGDGGNHEGPACGWVPDLPWSAMKETSFGFGVLTIQSSTEAEWVWHRNQDGEKVIADNTSLTTSSTRCAAATAISVAAVTV